MKWVDKFIWIEKNRSNSDIIVPSQEAIEILRK